MDLGVRALWFFGIYAVLGWCTEVVFAATKTGKFVNRGFLNGPWCPIYGFGMVLVILILEPLQEHLLILFAGSFLLTSLLEYATGAVLERFFHQKWWDYTLEPFNVKGYVCLRFSLIWGLACVFIMRIIQPIIAGFIVHVPEPLALIVGIVFYSALLSDGAITVKTLLRLQRQIRLLDEIQTKLNLISASLGENLAEGAVKGMQEMQERKQKFEEQKERLEEQKERLEEQLEEKAERMGERMEQLEVQIEESVEKLRRDLNALKAQYEASAKGRKLRHVRLDRAFPNLKLPTQKEVDELMRRLKGSEKS